MWSGIVRFKFNSQPVCNAIHERKVADAANDVVNRKIIEASCLQLLHVSSTDRTWLPIKLVAVLQHRDIRRRKVQAAEFFRGASQATDQTLNLFFGAKLAVFFGSVFGKQLSQTANMMLRSVFAAIRCRNHHRDHFSLCPGQRTRPMHRFDIQVVVQFHDARMHAMDLNDVVLVRDPIRFRNLVL